MVNKDCNSKTEEKRGVSLFQEMQVDGEIVQPFKSEEKAKKTSMGVPHDLEELVFRGIKKFDLSLVENG